LSIRNAAQAPGGMVEPVLVTEEVWVKTSGRLGVGFAIAAATLAAGAAEVGYDFNVCTTGRRTALEANADIVAFGVENWGVVASSTTPLFEKASTHCVGYLRIVAGKPVGKGACKWALAGGDTGVGEWEYPANGSPTWTWLAGTGKLKGISGGGTFQELFSAPTVDPGWSHGCRHDWGKIDLP
jgi:hypothetical protein